MKGKGTRMQAAVRRKEEEQKLLKRVENDPRAIGNMTIRQLQDYPSVLKRAIAKDPESLAALNSSSMRETLKPDMIRQAIERNGYVVAMLPSDMIDRQTAYDARRLLQNQQNIADKPEKMKLLDLYIQDNERGEWALRDIRFNPSSVCGMDVETLQGFPEYLETALKEDPMALRMMPEYVKEKAVNKTHGMIAVQGDGYAVTTLPRNLLIAYPEIVETAVLNVKGEHRMNAVKDFLGEELWNRESDNPAYEEWRKSQPENAPAEKADASGKDSVRNSRIFDSLNIGGLAHDRAGEHAAAEMDRGRDFAPAAPGM